MPSCLLDRRNADMAILLVTLTKARRSLRRTHPAGKGPLYRQQYSPTVLLSYLSLVMHISQYSKCFIQFPESRWSTGSEGTRSNGPAAG